MQELFRIGPFPLEGKSGSGSLYVSYGEHVASAFHAADDDGIRSLLTSCPYPSRCDASLAEAAPRFALPIAPLSEDALLYRAAAAFCLSQRPMLHPSCVEAAEELLFAFADFLLSEPWFTFGPDEPIPVKLSSPKRTWHVLLIDDQSTSPGVALYPSASPPRLWDPSSPEDVEPAKREEAFIVVEDPDPPDHLVSALEAIFGENPPVPRLLHAGGGKTADWSAQELVSMVATLQALVSAAEAQPPKATCETSEHFVEAKLVVAPAPTKPLPPDPWANVKRNDPCPCGSGKKFKKCHEGQPRPEVKRAAPVSRVGEIAPDAHFESDALMGDRLLSLEPDGGHFFVARFQDPELCIQKVRVEDGRVIKRWLVEPPVPFDYAVLSLEGDVLSLTDAGALLQVSAVDGRVLTWRETRLVSEQEIPDLTCLARGGRYLWGLVRRHGPAPFRARVLDLEGDEAPRELGRDATFLEVLAGARDLCIFGQEWAASADGKKTVEFERFESLAVLPGTTDFVGARLPDEDDGESFLTLELVRVSESGAALDVLATERDVNPDDGMTLLSSSEERMVFQLLGKEDGVWVIAWSVDDAQLREAWRAEVSPDAFFVQDPEAKRVVMITPAETGWRSTLLGKTAPARR